MIYRMFKTLREKDIQLDPQTVNGFHLFATIVILTIFVLVVGLVYWNILPPRKDLYNELWGPAHLLVNGMSPYDTASLNPSLPAAWLPMSIGFFAPMGWLGEQAALYFWFVFSLIVTGLIVMIVQAEYRPAHLTILTALFAFVFPPTVYHLLLGQFSLITTLCAVGAAYLIVRDRHWAGAFLLALGLSKPHLMTITMLGLSVWHFEGRGVRSMLAFWARIVIASLVLCLPLFVAYPNWMPDAFASMTSNAPWAFPTLLKFFTLNFGNLGMAVWGIVVIAVVTVSLLIWRRLVPITATYWSLGLALLISPYLGSWDFVTLLPIIIFTFMQSDWRRKMLVIFFYLTAWYGMAFVQALEESHNHYFWWVPVWFLVVLALVYPWKRDPSSTGLPAD